MIHSFEEDTANPIRVTQRHLLPSFRSGRDQCLDGPMTRLLRVDIRAKGYKAPPVDRAQERISLNQDKPDSAELGQAPSLGHPIVGSLKIADQDSTRPRR